MYARQLRQEVAANLMLHLAFACYSPFYVGPRGSKWTGFGLGFGIVGWCMMFHRECPFF